MAANVIVGWLKFTIDDIPNRPIYCVIVMLFISVQVLYYRVLFNIYVYVSNLKM